MTVCRTKHNKNYTTINIHICNDARLGYKSKGIWLYAFSRPDDWTFYLKDISIRSADGEECVKNGLKELEKFGYLTREKLRNDDGTYRYEYTFFEVPQEIKIIHPEPGFPGLVHPPLDNRRLLSTKELNTKTTTAAAAVFSCLEPLDIPEYEKLWISEHFPEPVVQHAVTWALHRNIKIKTTLVQTIKWACEAKPEIPPDIQKLSQDNMQIASKAERDYVAPSAGIEVLHKHVEVFFKAQGKAETIEYTEKDFEAKLQDALKRFGFKRKI